ncbi:hypothetical protein [Rhizobium sp. RU36D]|uniref:hypothetical protein n=1 Tax=Rhizobium sp. RU36D TaxID=1907415 RepID=UPI0009D7F238|nr:hypothetical protein [Rhizobium sp. RU36D]SMD20705.1 O-antigen ligase [Rhizobium sp. RU36D]
MNNTSDATADLNIEATQSANRLKIFSIVVGFFTWEGIPPALIGLPPHLGKHIVAAAILLASAQYMINLIKGMSPRKYETVSAILFTYCFFVSTISNGFIFINPPAEWVYAHYSLLPLLLPLAFRVFNISVKECIAGLLATGICVSILLIADQLMHLRSLEIFRRLATTDQSLRRIVLLKTEVSLAATVVLCRILRDGLHRIKIKNILCAAPMIYVLFAISESRLAIAAFVVGLGFFSAFCLSGSQRFRAIVLGLSATVFLFGTLGYKYIDQIASTENYIGRDQSITWRIVEAEYFNKQFQKTGGLGFGVMSTSKGSNNVLSFAVNYGGLAMGAYGYGIYIADMGIVGALFQFGYIGFIAVAAMSVFMIWKLVGFGRINRTFMDTGAVGAGCAGFIFSPWPLNFFTLEWSVFTGGFVWSLLTIAASELNSKRTTNTQLQNRHLS